MSTQKTFSPKAVCAATKVPAGTLATWSSRGYLKNFEAQSEGVGKARQFTLGDALALALIKAMSDAGFEPPKLALEAPGLIKLWLADPGSDRVLFMQKEPNQETPSYLLLREADTRHRHRRGVSITLSISETLSAVTRRLLSGGPDDE